SSCPLVRQLTDVLNTPGGTSGGGVPRRPNAPRRSPGAASPGTSILGGGFGGAVKAPSHLLLGLRALHGELAFRTHPGAQDRLRTVVTPERPRNQRLTPAPGAALRARAGR